jgi:hypothetical protein
MPRGIYSVPYVEDFDTGGFRARGEYLRVLPIHMW